MVFVTAYFKNRFLTWPQKILISDWVGGWTSPFDSLTSVLNLCARCITLCVFTVTFGYQDTYSFNITYLQWTSEKKTRLQVYRLDSLWGCIWHNSALKEVVGFSLYLVVESGFTCPWIKCIISLNTHSATWTSFPFVVNMVLCLLLTLLNTNCLWGTCCQIPG